MGCCLVQRWVFAGAIKVGGAWRKGGRGFIGDCVADCGDAVGHKSIGQGEGGKGLADFHLAGLSCLAMRLICKIMCKPSTGNRQSIITNYVNLFQSLTNHGA